MKQMWPTNSCCEMKVSPTSLTIAYPKPKQFPLAAHNSATTMTLHIGCLPFLQLNGDSFTTGTTSLPGLDITLSGNVAEKAKRTLSFDKSHKLHGAWHYRLILDFASVADMCSRDEVPVLTIGLQKTQPPPSPFLHVP